MRINKYLPFAFIYFFINSLGLPFGLTYTAILSPLFYWWILKQRKTEILIPFFVCLAPFIIIHNMLGVDVKAYIVSVVNYTAVYIFCQAFYTFLKTCEDPAHIFKKILVVNFIFCLIAIIIYFTPFNGILWMDQRITVGVDNFKRLKLFTYEASYYATLFTPLFFFYFLRFILHKNEIKTDLLFCMLILPYLLSFSIGAIGCVLLSCSAVFLIYFNRLARKKRVVKLTIVSILFFVSGLLLLWFFFPGNSLFLRLGNIFSGRDSSGNGRTFEAFTLAMKILDLKSYAWGIGAGQIKIIGAGIIKDFYLYPLEFTDIAIPNAAAETLAIFGWVGLSIRLLIELFLFFYTKVWTSYFRLMLFIFMFVYQFTGSFITNVAEYVIWILAFTAVFREFDVGRKAASYKL